MKSEIGGVGDFNYVFSYLIYNNFIFIYYKNSFYLILISSPFFNNESYRCGIVFLLTLVFILKVAPS